MLDGVSTKAHDELHVLANGVVCIPSGCQQRASLKKAESAGYDQVSAELVPAETSEEERPKIFDDLKTRHRPSRHARNQYPSALNAGRVR